MQAFVSYRATATAMTEYTGDVQGKASQRRDLIAAVDGSDLLLSVVTIAVVGTEIAWEDTVSFNKLADGCKLICVVHERWPEGEWLGDSSPGQKQTRDGSDVFNERHFYLKELNETMNNTKNKTFG